ncbi:hypothetical protein [Methanoculleus chikugoensis]|uniref:hypothetical protein n=1 Tax=Methanoculleus chikugoensis TaxID=118126 RepID=UPI001FB30C04|nr:hypothetical protein [Methanoculleus chikugoensis]
MRRLQGEEGGLPLAGGAGEGVGGAMFWRGGGVRAPKVRGASKSEHEKPSGFEGCYARLVREWNTGGEGGVR